MKKQNVPRDVISDGPPLEIYERCGWESPTESSEENELIKRRKMVSESATVEALKVMDRLSKEYFIEHLS